MTEVVWDAGSILKAMIFAIITTCTIFGNGAILLAVILRPKLLLVKTHCFITSLAIADFLVGLLVMPFLSTLNATGNWYFGKNYCTAFHCIHYWLCSASILSITAICIERYIAVCYPIEHMKILNTKRVIQSCAGVWVLAGFLSVVPLFIWPVEFPADPYVCPINFRPGHVIAVMVFIFYIPCIIMVGFYWKIYVIASAHLKRRTNALIKATKPSSSGNGTNSTSGSGLGTSSESSSFLKSTDEKNPYNNDLSVEIKPSNSEKEEQNVEKKQKVQIKLARKLAIVVGAFILSYFPFFTAFLVKALRDDLVPIQFFIGLGWIRYFNSCLNPFIYASMLKPFQDVFREFLEYISQLWKN